MKQVNVHYAKTHLSQILAEVEEGGEEFVIARAGKPVARIVREQPERKVLRKAGAMKGEIWFAPDYDEAKEEIRRDFEESLAKPIE